MKRCLECQTQDGFSLSTERKKRRRTLSLSLSLLPPPVHRHHHRHQGVLGVHRHQLVHFKSDFKSGVHGFHMFDESLEIHSELDLVFVRRAVVTDDHKILCVGGTLHTCRPWHEFWEHLAPWPTLDVQVIRLELHVGVDNLLYALNKKGVSDVQVLRVGVPSTWTTDDDELGMYDPDTSALVAFVTRNTKLRVLDLQCSLSLAESVQAALVLSCPSLLILDWQGASPLEYKRTDSIKDIQSGAVHRTRSDLLPILDARLRDNIKVFNSRQGDTTTFMGVDIPATL
jgi:hypothetical protein